MIKKYTARIFLLFPLFIITMLLVACQQGNDGLLGTLERKRIMLTAVKAVIVKKIYVHTADSVNVGDPLVQLDDVLAQLEIAKAKANLNEKIAELTKLENGAREEDVAAARAKLLSAESNLIYQKKLFQRTTMLVKENNESKDILDKVKSNYDSAQASYQDLREQLLKITNGSRPEDIMRLSSEVEGAQANLKLAEQVASDLHITATKAGTVEALPWHEGERVMLGSPVVVLLATGAPFVRVYVPEKLRTQLTTKQTVKVVVDGITKPFVGHITNIATEPSYTPYYALNAEDRSRLVYLAEVALSADALTLPSGMPAEVFIK